jgi:hypothetical protein
MKETQKEKYVTVDLFNETITRLETKMDACFAKMNEGFEMVFDLFEKFDQKCDDLQINKADREEVFALHKRVSRLEKRTA